MRPLIDKNSSEYEREQYYHVEALNDVLNLKHNKFYFIFSALFVGSYEHSTDLNAPQLAGYEVIITFNKSIRGIFPKAEQLKLKAILLEYVETFTKHPKTYKQLLRFELTPSDDLAERYTPIVTVYKPATFTNLGFEAKWLPIREAIMDRIITNLKAYEMQLED